MTFLRSLFLNFLCVFFMDRMAPGIQIGEFERIPNIGADLLFSAIVGLLNASVFPIFYIMETRPSLLTMAILTAIFSYGGFIIIALIPFGVHVKSALGVLVGGTVVWAVAYLTNYLEWRDEYKK